MGLSAADAWQMTPREIRLYYEGYCKALQERLENEARQADINAWTSGIYVAQAIGACFSKQGKYPQRPMSYKEPEKTASQMAAEFAAFAEKYNAARGEQRNG